MAFSIAGFGATHFHYYKLWNTLSDWVGQFAHLEKKLRFFFLLPLCQSGSNEIEDFGSFSISKLWNLFGILSSLSLLRNRKYILFFSFLFWSPQCCYLLFYLLFTMFVNFFPFKSSQSLVASHISVLNVMHQNSHFSIFSNTIMTNF